MNRAAFLEFLYRVAVHVIDLGFGNLLLGDLGGLFVSHAWTNFSSSKVA